MVVVAGGVHFEHLQLLCHLQICILVSSPTNRFLSEPTITGEENEKREVISVETA